MDLRHPEERTMPVIFVVIFALVIVGGVVDLVLDRPTSPWTVHVLFEVSLIAASLAGVAYLAHGWYEAQRDLSTSRAESERLEAERAAWESRSATLLRGLGDAIDRQFVSWELTPTERRVALMLLKGHSHKRMARATATSERTVRQHSVAVYRKSGLAGRAELAGFFLDALMVPETGDGSE